MTYNKYKEKINCKDGSNFLKRLVRERKGKVTKEIIIDAKLNAY